MRKKLFVNFHIFFICFSGQAQKPEQLLKTWSERSPIEKVYLHFDRDNYIAGENAWFKAYLSADFQPDTISTSLYAEILDEAGVLISRSIVPVILGTSNGYFELPDSMVTGTYTVRAYSPTMLSRISGLAANEADFIFRKNIFIYGKQNRNISSAVEKKIRMEFFPEGGNLVTGLGGAVAYKATNEKGLPVAVSGKLFNEKNEALTSFNSYHDGMGMFELTPQGNEKYYVLVEGDAAVKKIYLPAQKDKGIAVAMIPHPQGNFFELKQRQDDPAFQVAYMIGQMQHHVVFRQDFKTFREEVQGVIHTQHLHSGILQITFFNKDDQPLAERLCFVDNKEYVQQGKLIADTLNFSEKGKNRLSIQLKDTVRGSFSISIIDPEYSLWPVREENIFSALLLSSDLKGYIHNPAYYFSDDNDSIKTALDLVMMTNGWRRFNWTNLSQQVTSGEGYKDPSYITLTGKVTLRDSKKPFAEKPLLLMLITADSTRRIQMINTDKQGNFRLDSMLFFGRSSLLFSDIRGKKSQYIDVQLTGDSLAKLFQIPVLTPTPLVTTNKVMLEPHSRLDQDYDAIRHAKGVMLEGVTVKTRKKSPVEELEEKYTTGMFSGTDNKILDLINTPEADTYLNIFDYLQNRVPGLDFTNNEGTYIIYYRQTASASSMGPIPMIVYLNEIETDASVIATIPANQIAMVKLYSNFVGAVGNGAGGALAIYTKKGADMANVMQSAADMVKYNGYTVTKEFYAPDYGVDNSARTPADNRITLDWRPDILVNNINPKIPVTFYNSDRTKSFKIVVEGMTIDGKMLMIEETINRKDF